MAALKHRRWRRVSGIAILIIILSLVILRIIPVNQPSQWHTCGKLTPAETQDFKDNVLDVIPGSVSRPCGGNGFYLYIMGTSVTSQTEIVAGGPGLEISSSHIDSQNQTEVRIDPGMPLASGRRLKSTIIVTIRWQNGQWTILRFREIS